MSDAYTDMVQRVGEWFELARGAGWLAEDDRASLTAAAEGTPADLFVDRPMRPLVVALFGGTGVGKSSLFNRIAGAALAKTGEQRPTSREVTLYVHSEVELAQLPPELPVDAVQIKRHTAAEQRNILWIDAPDIDSTEEANRQRALAWLPHVDLVCYVVSPERYRDDVGWRDLRARGHRHGWIFILNRWDEGDPTQGDDFGRMLQEAGFEAPLLVRTCCRPGRTLPSPDEFDLILSTLRELLAAHGVRELERLGHRARLQSLRAALHALDDRLGTDAAWDRIRTAAEAHWAKTVETIRSGAEWPIQTVAARLATKPSSLWQQVRERALASTVRESEPETAQPDEVAAQGATLWDDWARSKLDAWLDSVEVAARRESVSPEPIRQHLGAVAESAEQTVSACLADHVRAALSRPGSALSRLGRRCTGFLMVFLPSAALLWVAWTVAERYMSAVRGESNFLGTPFVLHSIMLVLVAWAVPFTFDRLLRPSLEQIAQQALREGLRVALTQVGAAFSDGVTERVDEVKAVRDRSRSLQTEIAGLLVRPLDARSPALARVLARPQPVSK